MLNRRVLALVVGCALVTVAACDGAAPSDPDVATLGAGLVVDGTPDAVGLLSFVNDSATSVVLLDVDVALDRRAAVGIVIHRDGRDGVFGTPDDDRFDSVAELDAITYVGTAAMTHLVDYVVNHGLVPKGDDVLGTYDGVTFTVDQAAATLALANIASAATLDGSFGLDSRAVNSIIAGRPLASVLALSRLYYVGKTALTHLLKAAAAPPALPSGADVAAALASKSAGLYHTSESDYPFTVVRVPGAGAAPLTVDNVKAAIASAYVNRPEEPTLAERAVEVRTLADLFDRYTIPQDWWETYQFEQAPAFQALEDVLKGELIDVKVFRFGTQQGYFLQGAIDVFVIGRSVDGEVVGVSTISVET